MPFSEARRPKVRIPPTLIKRALSGLFRKGQLKCPGEGLVGRSAAAYKG